MPLLMAKFFTATPDYAHARRRVAMREIRVAAAG